MRSILSPFHVYIDTCASFASTLYSQLLKHLTPQKHGLVGYSNAGSCTMTSAGQFGDIRKMWLNKGGIATIVPLKQIKTIWPVSYDTCIGSDFVIHTNVGDVIAHTNPKGMPFLNLRDHNAAIALGLDNIETAMGGLEDKAVAFI